MAKTKNEINVVNKSTGEVFTFPTGSDKDIVLSYHNIGQMIKALERAKEKIRPMALDMLGERDEMNVAGFEVRRVSVTYKQYDTSVLRRELDEDLFATVMSPNKSMIDTLIAEGVKQPSSAAIPPEVGKVLRDSMFTERVTTKLTLERG